jgi:hypothetical protein
MQTNNVLKIVNFLLPTIMLSVITACQQPVKPSNQPACLNLNIMLADVPEPGGHPLAFTPWKIAIGEKPEGMALIDQENLLAEGQTDKDGSLNIPLAAQANIQTAVCVAHKAVWLLYPGQTEAIVSHKTH